MKLVPSQYIILLINLGYFLAITVVLTFYSGHKRRDNQSIPSSVQIIDKSPESTVAGAGAYIYAILGSLIYFKMFLINISSFQEKEEEKEENGIILQETKNDLKNTSWIIQQFSLSSFSLKTWLPFAFTLTSSFALICTTCAPTHVSEVLHYIFFGFFILLSEMISYIIISVQSNSLTSLEVIIEIIVIFMFALGTLLFLISTTKESKKLKNIGAFGTYLLFIVRPLFCISFWKKFGSTTIAIVVTKKCLI